MKSYRVEYVQLAGWEDDVVGLWLAENKDWLLLKHIPVDYITDGFVLLAKQHILTRIAQKRNQKTTELVLMLKGIDTELPPKFVFSDVIGSLQWVQENYGLVEFADEEESTFFGWVKESNSVHFWADTLTPKGQVRRLNDNKPPFVISEVQLIRFDTDYFNSVKLLWQYKTQQKPLKLSNN